MLQKWHSFSSLLLCSLFLFPLAAFAQQWVWAQHINCASVAYDEDENGNIYTLTAHAPPLSNFMVTCMNYTGAVLWTIKMPGSPASLRVGSNQVFVGGRFSDSISLSSYSLKATGTTTDGFLASFDLSGNVKWLSHLADSGNISMGSLCVTTNDDGYIHGRIGYNGRVWHFDNSGKITSLFDISGTNSEGITIDSRENIYVLGKSNHSAMTLSNLSFTTFVGDYGYYYFAKVDKSGVGQFLNKERSEYRYSITMPAIDSSGNIVWSDVETYSHPELSFLDSLRSRIWNKDLTASSGVTTFIKIGANNQIYLTGGGDGGPAFECHKVFYAKKFMFFGRYDINGNCQYVLSAPGVNYAHSLSIKTGKPLVLGYSVDTGLIQLGPLTVKGGYFLARIDENLLNTGASEVRLSKAHVFPNPAKHNISVCLDENTKVFRLNLLNSYGSLVLSKQCREVNCETLDISGLAKGIYFLEINGEARETKKVLIE